MKNKKGFKDLTEKDKRRLGLNKKKTCCNNPKPHNYLTEMFEPYTLCGNCGKEIL